MNFRKDIEDHVIGVLLSECPQYHAARFYAAMDPEELTRFIDERVTAGKGTFFVRVSNVAARQIDTVGCVNILTISVDVIAAAPMLKQGSLPGMARQTDVMMAAARGPIVENPVTIGDNPPRRLRYTGENDLYYSTRGTSEAQLLRFTLEGISLDFP